MQPTLHEWHQAIENEAFQTRLSVSVTLKVYKEKNKTSIEEVPTLILG
jgi:hypothetical protein